MLTIIIISLSLLLLPFKKSSFNWINSLTLLLLLSLMLIIKSRLYRINKLFINQYLTIDYIRLPLIILTLWISALIFISRFSIKINHKYTSTFIIIILTLNFFLLATFSVSNILLFYISFEATLIPTLFIILGWGYQPERLQAGFYLIIYTVTASLPLLIRVILIFKINNTLSFNHYIWVAPSISFIGPAWWIITIIAFITKIPLFSLHLWLPKAHVEAPVAGSIILAGLLLKLGRYGLLRLAHIFIYFNKISQPIISSIALWGAVITRIICLRQTDIKSLIAYSSVGHIGLLTAGVITSSNWGWESAILIIIAHGLCSSAIFALANIQYEATQTRNIYLTKGILSFFPIITILWFIARSGNIAAPPSLNLIAEIILISSILSRSIITAPILAMTAFLSASYSLLLFTTTQHGAPSNFINPIHLFTARNYISIIGHLIPLFTLCLKIDLFITWLI